MEIRSLDSQDPCPSHEFQEPFLEWLVVRPVDSKACALHSCAGLPPQFWRVSRAATQLQTL